MFEIITLEFAKNYKFEQKKEPSNLESEVTYLDMFGLYSEKLLSYLKSAHLNLLNLSKCKVS